MVASQMSNATPSKQRHESSGRCPHDIRPISDLFGFAFAGWWELKEKSKSNHPEVVEPNLEDGQVPGQQAEGLPEHAGKVGIREQCRADPRISDSY